jgi:hypothetical protein
MNNSIMLMIMMSRGVLFSLVEMFLFDCVVVMVGRRRRYPHRHVHSTPTLLQDQDVASRHDFFLERSIDFADRAAEKEAFDENKSIPWVRHYLHFY